MGTNTNPMEPPGTMSQLCSIFAFYIKLKGLYSSGDNLFATIFLNSETNHHYIRTGMQVNVFMWKLHTFIISHLDKVTHIKVIKSAVLLHQKEPPLDIACFDTFPLERHTHGKFREKINVDITERCMESYSKVVQEMKAVLVACERQLRLISVW